MAVSNTTVRTPNTRGHLIIPLQKTPRYVFSIELESNTYQFDISWNETIEAWYLNLKGLSNDVDIKGIRMCGGVNLLKPFALWQLGALYVIDGEQQGTDPNYDDIGSRYKLYYVPTTDPDYIV